MLSPLAWMATKKKKLSSNTVYALVKWEKGYVLFIYFNMVIWCRTYGKKPFIQQERKPAVTTIWATLSD